MKIKITEDVLADGTLVIWATVSVDVLIAVSHGSIYIRIDRVCIVRVGVCCIHVVVVGGDVVV